MLSPAVLLFSAVVFYCVLFDYKRLTCLGFFPLSCVNTAVLSPSSPTTQNEICMQAHTPLFTSLFSKTGHPLLLTAVLFQINLHSHPQPNSRSRVLEVHQRDVIQQEQKHCWTNTHFIGIFCTVFFCLICIMNVTNLFCCCFRFYSECNSIWEAALTGIVRYCWTSELMLLRSI